MKREQNYQQFIEDDFSRIKESFNIIDLVVRSPQDVGTYDLWIERGRKVKRGEEATRIGSTHYYPVPLWSNGERITNEYGVQKFGKYKTSWCLFHKKQTYKMHS